MEKSELSDQDLWFRLRSGDEKAISLLFKRFWEPLFLSAFNVLKDKAACEDIIQEIFIKIWNKRTEIVITHSFKAYLFCCMRHEVYRQIKAGALREHIFSNLYKRFQTPSIQEQMEHKELVEKINAIVDTLPERCKKVYQLSREEQLSHKEIAERLNISTKTVENHITRALHHLKISLGSFFFLLMMFILS